MSEYTNEDFGFGSNAYATPVNKKEEEKIAKSPTTPAKIQQAAVTATAPVVEAAPVTAPVASAAALPALPAASAGTPPPIQNPAQTGDFWASALAGAGIPVATGLAAGAAGNYLMNKFRGNAPAGAAAPAIEANAPVPASLSRLEEIQLQRAEHQLEVDRAKAAREATAFEEQQRRDNELHEKTLAEKEARIAKHSAGKLQQAQGRPLTDPVTVMEMQSTQNALSKSVDADMKASAAKAAAPTSPAPVVETPPATAPAPQAAQWSTPEEVAAQQAVKQAPAAPEVIPEAATPTTENKAPAVPNPEVVAAAVETNKKRRTPEQVAADNEVRPYNSAKRSILNNLGAKDSPEMDAKARAALGVLKEKVYGGEKVKQTGSHVNEQWAKGKAYILAHPEEFDPEIVERQKKSGEQIKSANQQKKSAKAVESQRGGINVDAVAEAGGKIAGAVKPVLGQAGALVGSEVKGAAAMLPFMLATDVRAQNAGYRRELEQQLKTERNASRAAELQSEIQKLDEDKYIKALKRRYVDKNIPSQLRPQ